MSVKGNEISVAEVKAKLAKPKIIVTMVKKGVGHYYQGIVAGTNKLIGIYFSVTGVLGIIGGQKMQALIGWSKKTVLNQMGEILKNHRIKTANPETSTLVNCDDEFIEFAITEAKRKPKDILEQAGDIGTRVHLLIDAYINGTMPEQMKEDEQIAYNNFMRFVFENDIKFVCGDLPVFSKKMKFGGRLDALGIIGGELVIFDWKTANAQRDETALQLGGYNIALFETYGIKATRGIAVRFDKVDPTMFEKEEAVMKVAEECFTYALKLCTKFKPGLVWKEDANGKNKEASDKADTVATPET